ncbi:hypothetical protein chiPu_0004116 [Chiloscyllium punctatum]|uniref:Ig-like domain-containing protein n=1 Tax=Chiloscyllium punctatum TaxID=137246 RepID=A0A401S5N5_CHIPU|nr:hypothetical protein [Chiloscyllium punctatum]
MTCILAREFEEEEEYLEIFMISKYQAGIYQCKAANEVSSADEKKVHITVNYAPTIKYAQSADVAVGRTGMLHCEVSAVPPADFEWYKEDKRIYNSSQGIQIQNLDSRSSLIVTNATEDHYGNYTCVAGNKLGIANASIFLYRPGSMRDSGTGLAGVTISLWLLAATLVCLIYKC